MPEKSSLITGTGAFYKAQERPFFILTFPSGNPVFLVPKLEESHMKKANIGEVHAYTDKGFHHTQGCQDEVNDHLQSRLHSLVVKVRNTFSFG